MSAFHFLRLFKHGAQMSPFFIQAMIQAWIEHKSTNEGRRPWLQVACNVAASPMLDENCPVWTEGCLTAQPLNPPFTYCPSSPPHILAGEAIAHTARQRPCSCIALMVPSYAQNRFLAHLSSNSRRHQSTKLMRDACNTSGGQSSIQSQSSRSGGRSPPHTTDGHDEW